MSKRNTYDIDTFLSGLEKGVSQMESYVEGRLTHLTAIVVREIGKKIAYDTTISRGLVQDILSELDAPEMQMSIRAKIYEYWKSYEEREEDYKDYLVIKSKGKINIVIDDYGIANQEAGFVSTKHPRKSKRVIPYPIETTLDMFLTGGNKSIDAEFESIRKGLINLIEKGGN